MKISPAIAACCMAIIKKFYFFNCLLDRERFKIKAFLPSKCVHTRGGSLRAGVEVNEQECILTL